MSIPSTSLFTVAALFLSQADESRARFEKAAATMNFFQTIEVSIGGGLDPFITERASESWRPIYELISARHKSEDLVALLKHADPKVRTLALGALTEMVEPKQLPHFAEMTADATATVPRLKMPPDGVPPDYARTQTVGAVAEIFLLGWIGQSGYDNGSFKDYWAARKDREYCAGWFQYRLYRAGAYGGSLINSTARVPI